jgi:hypothetical protein
MKKNIFFACCCVLILLMLAISSIPATNLNKKSSSFIEPLTAGDDEPPVIEIVNPVKGYFHFSGIKLFPTVLNLIADTMGFGGFRVRPVQVRVTDDIDNPEDIFVYMYVCENEQGEMIWNSKNSLHERKWIGPDLGMFNLTITAEDSGGNFVVEQLDVWYFCFVPE